jgi:hypothetical protein
LILIHHHRRDRGAHWNEAKIAPLQKAQRWASLASRTRL